jgi:hypothetical protein
MIVLGFVLMCFSAFFGLSAYIVRLPYKDGFESGDVSQWTGDYGKPRVVTSPKRCGNYALQCNVERGSEAVYVTFLSQSSVYGQAYISIPTLPNTAGEGMILFRFYGDTRGPSISLQNVNGQTQWRLRYQDDDSWRRVNSIAAIPLENTYFRIQIYFEGGVGGKCFVWVDDTQLFTVYSSNRLEPNVVNRFEVGAVYTNHPVDLHVDCVQIDTKYIQPVDEGMEESYNWIDRMKRHLHDLGFTLSVGSIALWLLTPDKKREKLIWIGVGLLIITFFISFHHFVITGKFFGLNNVLLHEFFMAFFGGIGIGVLITEYIKTHYIDTATMNGRTR